MYIDTFVSGRRYGGYTYSDYVVAAKNGQDGSVCLTFRERDGGAILGTLSLPQTVARWVGMRLVQCADDNVVITGADALSVRNDVALTKEAVAFNNSLIEDVAQLSLKAETVKSLKSAGVNRVIDLISLSEAELCDIPRLPALAVREIKESLDAANLSLGFRFSK